MGWQQRRPLGETFLNGGQGGAVCITGQGSWQGIGIRLPFGPQAPPGYRPRMAVVAALFLGCRSARAAHANRSSNVVQGKHPNWRFAVESPGHWGQGSRKWSLPGPSVELDAWPHGLGWGEPMARRICAVFAL